MPASRASQISFPNLIALLPKLTQGVPASFLIAIIACAAAFEWIDNVQEHIDQNNFILGSFILIALLSSASLLQHYSVIALRLFVICGLTISIHNWSMTANHVWLVFWLIAPLFFQPSHYNREEYFTYVRMTMGLVMLAAGVQKLISGNYLDGSYLQYLAHYGSSTEQLLSVFCEKGKVFQCAPLVYLSITAVIWQFAFALFLFLGKRHPLIVACEVGFLITVGFIADEMNFQVINLAALMLALRIKPTIIIAIVLFAFLLIDQFQLSSIWEVFFDV